MKFLKLSCAKQTVPDLFVSEMLPYMLTAVKN